MKTKQTKIDRSAAKWLPGAMALAATTASTQAATVQITLTGNKVSTLGGNQLVADLTGDGTADVSFSNTVWGTNGAVLRINVPFNQLMRASFSSSGSFVARPQFSAGGAGIGSGFAIGPNVQSTSYLNVVTFTDSRINGGAPTGAWLQVNAFNTSATDHTVELSRLIFDDASTTRPSFGSIPGVQTEWQVSAVPEASTSLGLLALGAGGILTRRRSKRAA